MSSKYPTNRKGDGRQAQIQELYIMKTVFLVFLIFFAVGCKQKLIDKNLIVGRWITSSVYDSVESIHTFDEFGNYLIDDSSNGMRVRKFTNRYSFSTDGKYLVVFLAGGGTPQLEITKLTENQLELTIGSHTRKYIRF